MWGQALAGPAGAVVTIKFQSLPREETPLLWQALAEPDANSRSGLHLYNEKADNLLAELMKTQSLKNPGHRRGQENYDEFMRQKAQFERDGNQPWKGNRLHLLCARKGEAGKDYLYYEISYTISFAKAKPGRSDYFPSLSLRAIAYIHCKPKGRDCRLETFTPFSTDILWNLPPNPRGADSSAGGKDD